MKILNTLLYLIFFVIWAGVTVFLVQFLRKGGFGRIIEKLEKMDPETKDKNNPPPPNQPPAPQDPQPPQQPPSPTPPQG